MLNNTRVTGNTTPLTNVGGGGGGGVSNRGTLTLIGSSILNNTVVAVSNINGVGGGLWNAGTLNVTNSPIIGNTVTGPFPWRRHLQHLRHNHPAGQHGGRQPSGGDQRRRRWHLPAHGTVTLIGSSVAANQPNNCGSPRTVPGCS
jgi:hypothetical protein